MTDIDLNLLRVFDALFELRSVTRAASRLGVTQSAVSHALGRLRTTLNDPLFLRSSSGLQPTPRALEIAPGIRDGLNQLRGALTPSIFEPASESRHFTIAAGSYFCGLLIPALVACARTSAPSVTFAIVTPTPDLLAALDDGTVDLAMGAFGKAPPRILVEHLFREELVWIASAANAEVRAASTQELAGRPRLQITAGRPNPGQGFLTMTGGLEWRVGADSPTGLVSGPGATVSIYDAVTAASIVQQTDLVARVPRQFALRTSDPKQLAVIDTQSDAEGIDMSMISHRRLEEDAGLTWLRGLIRKTLDALLAPGAAADQP